MRIEPEDLNPAQRRAVEDYLKAEEKYDNLACEIFIDHKDGPEARRRLAIVEGEMRSAAVLAMAVLF